MFIYSLELATIIILGLLYIFPDILPSNEPSQTPSTTQYNLMENHYFKKLTLFLARIQIKVNAKIPSESCCICLTDIKNEVRSCCGHTFCGSCLFKLWYAKGQERISCPLCRKGIKLMMFDQAREEGNLVDHETESVIRNVKEYNSMFAKPPETINQVLDSAHAIVYNYMASYIKEEDFLPMMKKALGALVGFMVVVYVVSPTVIIPTCSSIMSWMENMLLIVFSVLYATVKYKDTKKNEFLSEDSQLDLVQ